MARTIGSQFYHLGCHNQQLLPESLCWTCCGIQARSVSKSTYTSDIASETHSILSSQTEGVLPQVSRAFLGSGQATTTTAGSSTTGAFYYMSSPVPKSQDFSAHWYWLLVHSHSRRSPCRPNPSHSSKSPCSRRQPSGLSSSSSP